MRAIEFCIHNSKRIYDQESMWANEGINSETHEPKNGLKETNHNTGRRKV